MASPLSGSLATTIYRAMKNLFIDATLLRDATGSTSPTATDFDPSPGAITTTEYPCLAVVENYSAMLRKDGIIQANDRKVIILNKGLSVTPVAGDRITVRGITFTIQEVAADPALATWECRGRF